MSKSQSSIASSNSKGKPPITREYLQRLFSYEAETGNLIWKHRPVCEFATLRGGRTWNSQNPGTVAGTRARNKNGTRKKIQIRINGIVHAAHRLIYILNGIDLPDGMEIDHKNRDPWDNRLDNLRIATSAQNHWNFGKRQKNGMPKGVTNRRTKKKPFFAVICSHGKFSYGPYKDCPIEAGEDYKKLAQEIHGEFACVS
jgi:hypothetical protein